MVDRAGLALLARVHRFDAVAVRVAQERAVVVLSVLRPRTGRAVVGVAGLDAGAVEGVDELVRRRVERDVEVPRDGLTVGGDREIAPIDVLGVVHVLRAAEHGEDGLVEALGRGAVRDADVHMVEHPAYCAATSMQREVAKDRDFQAPPR